MASRIVSFSKTSNSTRPSDSCFLRSLKNSLVHVISKLHSKPCYYLYKQNNHCLLTMLNFLELPFESSISETGSRSSKYSPWRFSELGYYLLYSKLHQYSLAFLEKSKLRLITLNSLKNGRGGRGAGGESLN
jgi:hypothetical protein